MAFQRCSLLAAGVGAALVVPTAAELPTVNPDNLVSMHALGAVDCGGHFAENCLVCPGANGELWCNGDCMWYAGHCEYPTLWHHLLAYTHYSFWLWWHCLPVTFLIGLAMAAYAIVYKKKVVDEIPNERIPTKDDDFDDWRERKVGLGECGSNGSQCLWATFCSPVVSAKNFSTGGVQAFWPSCCMVFCGIYSLFWPIWCVMAIVRTSLSVKLQRNLGFQPNWCVSFFYTLCCFPCEVGRESIEVDEALGVEIKCPFEVEKTWGATLEMAAEQVEGMFDRTCHTRMCS